MELPISGGSGQRITGNKLLIYYDTDTNMPAFNVFLHRDYISLITHVYLRKYHNADIGKYETYLADSLPLNCRSTKQSGLP